jgi:hypothetical protein
LNIPVSSVGHGKSGGSSALLCLDDLITTELNTVDKSIHLVSRDVYAWLRLAEERYNSLARVTTNDGNVQVSGVLLASDLSDECLGTDDIEGSNTEEPLGIEDACLLEDLCGDRDGRVDGVGDDEDERLGAVLGNTLDEALNDTGVDLEEIVTGHTRLACALVSMCYCSSRDLTYEEYRQG